MNLFDFFTDVYRTRRLLGKSDNTSRLYTLSIRSFGRTIGKNPTLDDLTEENLAKHMQRVLDDGRSRATANKDRAQLLALWRLASKMNLVDTWPDVPQVSEPERIPTAWLAEELDQLLQAAQRQPGDFCRVPRSAWWRSLILLCLDTAERIGAVSLARWDWMHDQWFTVPAEARKGKTRDRSYRLSPSTIESIDSVRAANAPGPKIFPWPYCKMYLWTLYKKLLVEAGLPTTRRDKFHRLRRTTASAVHAAGLDAQEALDHQYRRTTQRYLDPRFKTSAQPCDVLAKYLASPGKKKKPPKKRGAG